MDDTRLRAIEARLAAMPDAVRGGDWQPVCDDYTDETAPTYWVRFCGWDECGTADSTRIEHGSVADFLAHSRDDVRDLLAALREANAAILLMCNDSSAFDHGREVGRNEAAAMIGRCILAGPNEIKTMVATLRGDRPPVLLPEDPARRRIERLEAAVRRILSMVDQKFAAETAREALEGGES